jgi:hypothetical protein
MTFPPEKLGVGPQAASSVVIVVDRLTVSGLHDDTFSGVFGATGVGC